MSAPQSSAYWWMLSSAVSFTAMGALAHSLADSCPWPVVALVRTTLAFLFAAVIALRRGVAIPVFRPKSLWLRSLAGSTSLVLTFYALQKLPLANTLTLTNMAPVWIALLSWPFLGEVPTGGVWAAVGAGIVGVYLIQRPESGVDAFASWCALGASASTAFAMMGLHRVKSLHAAAIVAHFSAVSSVFALIACFAAGASFSSIDRSPAVFGTLIAVGVTATAGQLAMTRAYASGRPSFVAVVGLSQVAFGMIVDVLVWRRTFDAVTLLGMALVLAPTAWLLSRGK